MARKYRRTVYWIKTKMGRKKMYAVRDERGRFVDIQSYKRAHGQDIRRKSKAERAR